jgi:hypothetical protein
VARSARSWFYENESFLMAGTLAGLVAWYSVVSGVVTFSPSKANPHRARPAAALVAQGAASTLPGAVSFTAPAPSPALPALPALARPAVVTPPMPSASVPHGLRAPSTPSKPVPVRAPAHVVRPARSAEPAPARASSSPDESAAARRELEAVTRALTDAF